MGEHSRLWILGDPNQSDLKGRCRTDFVNFCYKLRDDECVDNGIESFEFGVDDIIRSEFCKFVVKKLGIYEHAEDFGKLEIPEREPLLPPSVWSPSE